MQIIVMSRRLRQARTIEIRWRHVGLVAMVASLAVVVATAGLSYATLSSKTIARLPVVERMVAAVTEREARRNESYVRENINVLAGKLGEMQAQITRLDALGERVVGLAGLKIRDLKLTDPPGRGGPPVEATARTLSFAELTLELDSVSARMDNRGDALKIMEDELLRERARRTLLPTVAPVDVPYQVSGFGWRIDPFSGRGSLHEGVDFAAPTGTPILAAAGGIVITHEFHAAYGNMIELDHGNGLVTRYAHASKLNARLGEVVKRGQKIAEVGSTGYSTGPHLHFEVRQQGVAQNPSKFLYSATK